MTAPVVVRFAGIAASLGVPLSALLAMRAVDVLRASEKTRCGCPRPTRRPPGDDDGAGSPPATRLLGSAKARNTGRHT